MLGQVGVAVTEVLHRGTLHTRNAFPIRGLSSNAFFGRDAEPCLRQLGRVARVKSFHPSCAAVVFSCTGGRAVNGSRL